MAAGLSSYCMLFILAQAMVSVRVPFWLEVSHRMQDPRRQTLPRTHSYVLVLTPALHTLGERG